MRLNIAAFFSKYKGIQLTLDNCTASRCRLRRAVRLPVNAGNADIKGIEVETNCGRSTAS